MMQAVALGELLVDFSYEGQNDGGYPVLSAHPGGAPCNFLCTMAACGAKTAFIGKVGNDAFGQKLLRTLKEHHVDIDGAVIDSSAFTTMAFVTLDDKGDRSFSFARKPGADAMLREDELNWNLLRNAQLFHFGTLSMTGSPSREATCKAVLAAKESGAIISFDPNYRKPLWRNENDAAEQILWGVKHSDIVKMSEEELEILLHEHAQTGAKRLVEQFGVKLAFVTMGEKGVYFQNKNAGGVMSAFSKFPVIDTTGAGDIFIGSADFKILETGISPEKLTDEQLIDICRFATVMAGYSTSKKGGIPSIPYPKEIEKYINEE